jgi:hypothetical protein
MTNVTGAIKAVDLPEDFCITTTRELVKALERYLAVEFGVEQITNVVVSSAEPDAADRDIIWFRLDTSGNFLGIYVFVQGQWDQMFPAPSSVVKMYGDSRDVPRGYALVTEDLAGFTLGMVTKLQEEWLRDPGDTYWMIFHVVYTGL